MGYNVDKIEMVLSTRIRIEECYKKLITDLCALHNNWSSKEAKWLDECKQSTDVNIDLNSWRWVTAQTDVIGYGTVSPSSVDYCYPLPGIGTKDQTVTVITGASGNGLIDTLARTMYKKIADYWLEHYGSVEE